MNTALRSLRALAASISLATALTATGVILAPLASADFGTVRATTAVNIRTSPTTSSSILGVLYQGDTALQTGAPRNGFIPVVVNGRSGWVAINYLFGAKASADAPASSSGATGIRYAQAALNLRMSPSTSASVITVLPKGTRLTLTGVVTTGWAQVTWQDGRAWVSSAWIASTAPGTTITQLATTTQARTTTTLMIRTSATTSFRSLGEIPRGTVVDLTGLTEPGVAQIVWRGDYRWVNASYLVAVGSAPAPAVPKVPTVIGTQYATALLNIRTTSGSDSVTITEVPVGTALQVTGTVVNGRAEIVWNGASRWVTAQYLAATAPSAPSVGDSQGLSGLTPYAQAVVAETRQQFPFILTIYGVRPDPLPDHPSGRAVDLMLPSWSSAEGNARGWQVATYMRANAARLNIQYVIFDQKIWNVSRDAEGWRSMADRGSSTANHRDHVHITVQS